MSLSCTIFLEAVFIIFFFAYPDASVGWAGTRGEVRRKGVVPKGIVVPINGEMCDYQFSPIEKTTLRLIGRGGNKSAYSIKMAGKGELIYKTLERPPLRRGSNRVPFPAEEVKEHMFSAYKKWYAITGGEEFPNIATYYGACTNATVPPFTHRTTALIQQYGGKLSIKVFARGGHIKDVDPYNLHSLVTGLANIIDFIFRKSPLGPLYWLDFKPAHIMIRDSPNHNAEGLMPMLVDTDFMFILSSDSSQRRQRQRDELCKYKLDPVGEYLSYSCNTLGFGIVLAGVLAQNSNLEGSLMKASAANRLTVYEHDTLADKGSIGPYDSVIKACLQPPETRPTIDQIILQLKDIGARIPKPTKVKTLKEIMSM